MIYIDRAILIQILTRHVECIVQGKHYCDKGGVVKDNIKIFPDIQKISEFLLLNWEEWAAKARASDRDFMVALSGGKTPVPFYERLVTLPETFPWEIVHFFMVDERFVKPGHRDHNFSNIQNVLFDQIEIPDSNLHAIDTKLSGPMEAVYSYESKLSLLFRERTREMPRFDLILLGIGGDGHTASLFPGAEMQIGDAGMIGSLESGSVSHSRVTMTFPLINAATRIVFLVTGSTKASAVRQVVQERNRDYPAARVEAQHGELLFLLDEAAASMLDYEEMK